MYQDFLDWALVLEAARKPYIIRLILVVSHDARSTVCAIKFHRRKGYAYCGIRNINPPDVSLLSQYISPTVYPRIHLLFIVAFERRIHHIFILFFHDNEDALQYERCLGIHVKFDRTVVPLRFRKHYLILLIIPVSIVLFLDPSAIRKLAAKHVNTPSSNDQNLTDSAMHNVVGCQQQILPTAGATPEPEVKRLLIPI